MNRYLEKHNFPDDIKDMSYDDLELLSYEIRDFLVDTVSETGGHLSSNLGVVEISLAVHKVFDPPEDKIIWDVGHQTYVHKILTGRIGGFQTLRRFNGMSGFPKMAESEYDLFDTGHSSTSISLGLGMAAARDLKKEDHNVISIIGDGAMTGGMAFEALNNADNLDTRMIVLLNDNGMSIAPNTGGLSKHLSRLRGSRKYLNMKAQIKKNVSKVPVIGESMVAGMQHARDSIKYAMIEGVVFEGLGFRYIGPIDGHDIKELCETLEIAKEANGPVLIHAITKKGKGYTKAEENPDVFHGVGPFDPETGSLLKRSQGPSYSAIFGSKLEKLAAEDDRVVAVSAAMTEGTGLKSFAHRYPERTFDVGIAEEHAVTFAAGLAKAGMKPFVAIYSTFLQRGYDQIIEDACLQKMPVVFCLDRAGIVGADGETHHGIFDIGYLRQIPDMTVMAPKDGSELAKMMDFAITLDSPCAIRYPRGTAPQLGYDDDVAYGRAQQIKNGADVEIWALGAMVEKAVKASEILSGQGIDAGVVNMRFAKPLDITCLAESAKRCRLIVTVEDNLLSGGVGEAVDAALVNEDVDVMNIGWPDKFIEHGSSDELYEKYRIDASSIAERITERLEKQA